MLASGSEDFDGARAIDDVSTVAKDMDRRGRPQFPGSLAGTSHHADKLPVRIHHHDSVRPHVDNVRIARSVEGNVRDQTEALPVVAHVRPDGVDVLGDGDQHDVRALQGARKPARPGVTCGVVAGEGASEHTRNQHQAPGFHPRSVLPVELRHA